MKILNKKTLKETKYLNLVETEYENNKGKKGSWVFAQRTNNTNAVVIVAIVPGDEPRLVVIREYRVPLENYIWELPAGLIDKNQSIEETAIRELKEETGLDIVKFIRPVSPLVYNSPGLTNEAISYAFVEVIGSLSTSYLHDNEDIMPFLYNKKEIKNLLNSAIKQKIMIGAKVWTIFEKFVKYGDI